MKTLARMFCYKATPRRSVCRVGLTLIELMIAVVITLVIVAAMIRAFKLASDEIGVGRAAMDLHNQLRAVTETLRRDLQNATCVPRPRGISDERSGYFEYVESDEYDSDHTDPLTNSHIGDHNDILALTVRSTDRPFRGRFNGAFVESYLAEVVWWTVAGGTDTYDGNVQLYRRVLLIRPDLTTAEVNFDTFYADNDVSVRRDPVLGGLVMNSLESLAGRGNRFAHASGAANFPNEFQRSILDVRPLTGDNLGDDLMLANCLAFDIKLLSPNTTVKLTGGQTVELSDPGYAALPITTVEQTAGGYVDLGVANGGWFTGPAYQNGYSFTEFPYTYCTWSATYESDGFDQDGVGGIDQGTNGLDDDLANGVDDNGERETQPPYPHPIRSLQVSVRMIDKKTNQVLQKSIKESFVPN